MQNQFRTSKSKSIKINLLKTFAYSTVFWIIFLVIFPSIIYSVESQFLVILSPNRIFGGLLFLLFSVINIWSGIAMGRFGNGTPLPIDCASKLVIRGPYKYVRNPMAIGGIGQGISVGLFIGSFFTIIYAIIGAFIWHIVIRPVEEKDLENRFGKQFLEYTARVKTWIPKFY